ncbi:MAG TPA: tryptophan 7-halogenase [Sphingomonas sp.]|nr:tryptophan 7-halogenase [Sphingomonas sp.]
MNEPIRSVVVIGGGLVGLSAALGFARALPRAEVSLVGVPLPPDALADRLPATLPGSRAILARIGVDEADLLRSGGATHRIADRFAGWRAQGGTWLHGFGETGMSLGSGAFHQSWLDARRAGAATMFDRFSPAAALAEAGRFVDPVDDPRSLLSRFDYALRLDPVVATRGFAARAQRVGIAMAAGQVEAVSRHADGDVAGVRLAGGRTLAADLYVDCSGSAAILGAPEEWVEWGDALPVDRLLLAEGPAAPSPLDDYAANEAGWRAVWPLADRTLWGLGYAGAITPEARARRIMGPAGAVAEAIAIRPGRRRSAWRGNVLALGDAAAACGPLGWAGLALAQANLALALDLLPGRDLHPLLLAEYNRRAGMRADRVRDFLALHYLAASRTAGPFWRQVREAVPPPDVAHAIAMFLRHGQLPRHDEELYDKHSWLAVLLGLGLVPAHRDPMATDAPGDARTAAMAQLQAAVAALPTSLPAYRDYLARVVAA